MFGTVAHRPRFAPSMCLICSLVLFIYFFSLLLCMCRKNTLVQARAVSNKRATSLCNHKKKKKKKKPKPLNLGAALSLIDTSSSLPPHTAAHRSQIKHDFSLFFFFASMSKFFETEPQCLLFWAGTWCRWAVQGFLPGICLKSCRSCSD